MTKYFEMILAIETPSFNKMKTWRVYQKMRHKAEVRNAITKAILSSDEPFPRLVGEMCAAIGHCDTIIDQILLWAFP